MTIERVELGLTDAGAGCACCATPSTSTMQQQPADAGMSTTLLVEGMTCAHCVASVTEELSTVPGVDDVSVALTAGGTSTVAVRSSAPVDADALRVAVAEAGYTVIDAS
ncbi:heavy-metal-associated domain-containing protein [Microbacterium paludicola]|uniref:heavy-metal-associated domain-containing protein n=1 Tax=Microbacterium paludicola TaxID=300019 RepID=UPI0038793A31